MDEVTIGKKIKEVTGAYEKVPDEDLGKRYLAKYNWFEGVGETSGQSGQLRQNFAYNDETGGLLQKLLLGIAAPITQGPMGKYSHQNYIGWDYGTPVNTALKAAQDIVAEYMPNQGIYGNRLLVTLPTGKKFYISHLQSGKSGRYKAGDVYGYSGNTGKSSGPHVEIAPAG